MFSVQFVSLYADNVVYVFPKKPIIYYVLIKCARYVVHCQLLREKEIRADEMGRESEMDHLVSFRESGS